MSRSGAAQGGPPVGANPGGLAEPSSESEGIFPSGFYGRSWKSVAIESSDAPKRRLRKRTGDGGSAEVDDLLPDRGGIDLPTDTFNDGEGPTEAELQEFAGDVEMEPEEEAEVPAEGKGKAPDREAEVPQAAAASQPSVESPAAKHRPIGRNAGLRIQSTPRRRMRRQAQPARVCRSPTLPSTLPEHPGEAPELMPAEVRHHQEQSSYLSSRGSRTSARPAEHRSNRRFIVQHVLAREAGEPFIYAVIRNKAIARERVTAEEWKKASETSHRVS